MSATRSDRYRRLSQVLTSYTELELGALVDGATSGGVGVGGGSAVLDVGGVPVFVNRIPLTERELARWGSTANLYGLFCQYGIGGPSFNAMPLSSCPGWIVHDLPVPPGRRLVEVDRLLVCSDLARLGRGSAGAGCR